MADPFSVIAAAASVIRLTLATTKELENQTKDVRQGSDDWRLLAEAAKLSYLLECLEQRIAMKENPSWISECDELVRQFEADFVELAKALDIDIGIGQMPSESRLKSSLSSASWRFDKYQRYGLLHRVEEVRQCAASLMSATQAVIPSHVNQQQNEAVERKRIN